MSSSCTSEETAPRYELLKYLLMTRFKVPLLNSSRDTTG